MQACHIPSRYEFVMVQKLKHGYGDAFATTSYPYSQSQIEFARLELKADDFVDDVVQDVFVKLRTYSKILKTDLSIEGFPFTCLKNLMLNLSVHKEI